jgi:DNA-directed RNA polymerase
MPQWDTANPLVLHDSLTATPVVRGGNLGFNAMGADPVELHQNLYACLRVGRLERAAIILDRLSLLYEPHAAELLDAHNVYMHTLFETSQQDPKETAMAKVHDWYTSQVVQRGITPNGQTFVTLIRATMHFVEQAAQEATVRRYLDMAREYGEHVVDDINASPDFSDEEWDMLIRLQPDSFDEPPPVDHVQHLHVDTPSGRQNLVEHGLPNPAQFIKPVPQKGLGLDSLKQALNVFDAPERVPFPDDMPGTQEEKEQAHQYARQLQAESDGLDAAVRRWKQEEEKLQKIGIHGVLQSKPMQAIMYNWYSSLVPLFKKRIEHVRQVLTAPPTEHLRDDAHSYGAWLERCTPEKLAAITVARVIQSTINDHGSETAPLKISALTIAVGTDIQDHLNTDALARRDAFLKKQRKQTRKDLVSQLSKTKPDPSHDPSQETLPKQKALPTISFEQCEIPLAARTKLGAMCVELLLQTSSLMMTVDDPKTGKKLSRSMAAFHHQVGFFQGKKLGYLVPHHELMAKLRSESVHSINSVRLPMVVEPKPWSSYEDGGYYTIPQKVVRQKGGDYAQRAYAQSAIQNGDMKKVLAGLDGLGRVPWQINAPVFQVMSQVWNSGETLGGLLGEKTDLERPVEPPADAPYQERMRWAKALQQYENAKGGLHSQRCFQNFQLETARALMNEKKIYFPHSVDFRGRAYPIPPILNHIGSDLARGLLKFANGKELGTVGLQWLKIHLANLYGFDKASLREREQFAMDNINEIYDSATNPLEGRRWWANAEDPWQCLACCIELKNAFDSPDPTRYLSQQPVHQDGTCNGLQHYAALGGDEAGARQVNLEPSDRPQDIYTGVAELVKEMVVKGAAEGNAVAQFIDGHITRKVVKRTVMTNVYGVTFMGAKKQVESELEAIFPNFRPTDKINSLAVVALYVAHKIFEALGQIFNGAQEIQYWLGECGDRITSSITAEQVKRIQRRFEGLDPVPYDTKFTQPKTLSKSMVNKLNKSMESFQTGIIWTTPLKMPIVQPYRKEGVQKIRTNIQDITVSKRSQTDAVDKRKQLQAFPPNFIHSLDATHMILSALKANEMGLDFAAVHDSFWTHASDIPNLNVILRDAFVRMHSENIIDRLAAEFSARYAGSMYRVPLSANSEVSRKITRWRRLRNQAAGKSARSPNSRFGEASFEEVALESQRQELLKSEDPEERKKGQEMETPTSIWLANQDPEAITSLRLQLIGQTKEKQSVDRQKEVKDKILGAEAEAADVSYTLEVATEENVEDLEDVANEIESSELNSEANSESKKEKLSRAITNRLIIHVWVPLSFPPVPEKGGWDVSRLRESKYFFS